MYTQCPECEIAFKVTAEVLKQAAGKVRCGGCANAFNALLYLSEEMPSQREPVAADAALPELTPESIETDSGLPKTISAEQSAALLKTLDELAGSDIRIEDTGIEWRVLDDNDANAPAAGDEFIQDEIVKESFFKREMAFDNVDELLDDDPTPVDEFLTATPEIIDSPEIFEDPEMLDSGPTRTIVDELRFDDNTPHPDDFDFDGSPAVLVAPVTDPAAWPEPSATESDHDDLPADIELSEPDEWADILGEFEDRVQEVAAPLDMDTQFALQAEAMGIDLSGLHETAESSDLDGVAQDLDAQDLADEETISDDLLDERLPHEELPDEDVADEFALEFSDELLDDSVDLDDPTDESPDGELDEDESELDDVIAQLNLIDDDDDEAPVLIDEPIVENHSIEAELASLDSETSEEVTELAEADIDGDPSGEHYVPPLSEAEQTVNMQIDQDLMALAIEDEDGFASTIIIPHGDAEKMVAEESLGAEDDSEGASPEQPKQPGDFDEDSGFETIIMEGEIVRSALDSKKLAADVAAAAEMAAIATAQEAEAAKKSQSSRTGIIAGVAALLVLLAVQIMHQSREALATIPAFSNTVGQVYRALGQPVQPAWDITGWRFEATKGSTEGESGHLTVYSRLGNKSDGPLPYPLIGISLTDRFEETLGSRMLDPGDYLTEDLDPRKLVEPGKTFNAVITIKSTAEDATGFKLNVCYRLSDGQLRCAIDDFK